MHPSIRFPDRQVIPLEVIYDSQSSREAYLKPFHRSDRRPRCTCVEKAPDLVIKCRDNVYSLACYQGTTEHHHPACYFYSPSTASLSEAYTLDAVEPRGEGLYVRLNRGLNIAPPRTRQDVALEQARPQPPAGRRQVRRNTVTLLGLMQIIWERAGLHCWHPRKGGYGRRYSEVEWALWNAAESIELPAGSLADHFFVPPPSIDKDGMLLKRKLDAYPNQCVVVIGEVFSHRETPYGHALSLKCLNGVSLFFSHEQWKASIDSFREPGCSETEKTWAIAFCSLSPKGYVVVQEAAWMHCNRDHIPVHSSHELRVVDMLIEQQRLFTKPLRFDTSEDDKVFPDFILHDVPGVADYFMEIWGLTSPTYQQRLLDKKAEYSRNGARLWEWHAYRPGEEIPPFPPVRR